MSFPDLIASRRRPLVMGVVNVTPDSFSDGGERYEHSLAIEHALQLAELGAEIIDVGGESTRPPGATYGEGARRVDADEEIARVVPVIEGIRRSNTTVEISVDTMKATVAEAAIAAGATIVNDVSAARHDERILEVAARSHVPYVLMHGHDPRDLRPLEEHRYTDVVADVLRFLRERIAIARAAGIEVVIADVGIGFAKGARENIALLREHRRFDELDVPMLVGASRKAFIGGLLGGVPPKERVIGTLAAHAVAALNGASIVRVHDVAETLQFFTVFEALVAPVPVR
jgi:dihydropteroate synthase